jgi:hypothetical protein
VGTGSRQENATKQKFRDAPYTNTRPQCLSALVVVGFHDALLIVFRGENAARRERVPHFFARTLAVRENRDPCITKNAKGKA